MSLVKDNGFSLSGSVGGISGGIKFADNALTCDSEGNCMLKDDLIKIGGSFGGIKGGIQFADNALTCDSAGNCMLKDNLGMFKSIANVAGTKVLPMATSYATGGLVKASVSVADNALTCDSEGNCMLKDNLGSAKGCVGKLCGGVKWADNSLTCDSEGNCMLKDELIKIGGSFGGIKGGIQFADNALTCDSAGNCMLKDNLRLRKLSIKEQIAADLAKETGGLSIKDKVAADIQAEFAEKEAAKIKESVKEEFVKENPTATSDEIAKAVQAELMEATGGLSVKDAVAAEIKASLWV